MVQYWHFYVTCNLWSLQFCKMAQAQNLYQWDLGLALAGQETCPGFLAGDKINGRGCAVSPWPPETLPGQEWGWGEEKTQHKTTVHPGAWCLQAGKPSPLVL